MKILPINHYNQATQGYYNTVPYNNQNFGAMKTGKLNSNVTPQIRKLAGVADELLNHLSGKRITKGLMVGDIKVDHLGKRLGLLSKDTVILSKKSATEKSKEIAIMIRKHLIFGTTIDLIFDNGWKRMNYSSRVLRNTKENLSAFEIDFPYPELYTELPAKNFVGTFEEHVSDILSHAEEIKKAF